ncbi:MAG: transaldolase family protein [Pirellulaceae bacterium]|nr:transaldolase [Planctomycetales bacterium]
MSPLESLIASGTKLWLDSVDPELVATNRALGATGATSNPVIVSQLLATGRFDDAIQQCLAEQKTDSDIAWEMTDRLVRDAQAVFRSVWDQTAGNDGYVSFELDPLLEDPNGAMSHDERVARYIKLGTKWSAGHDNRMIKVPATPAGIAALESLVSQGVTVNVTLIFSDEQYQQASAAVWRGAQSRSTLAAFKSVYSIFVSRIDVYTEKHVPQLSPASQGQVGIVNAKRIWRHHREFWQSRSTPLDQEIIFASTGTKKPGDAAWKYVEALAGSDIQTNPPETNEAVQVSGLTFSRNVDKMPADSVLREIDAEVDFQEMERVLMAEGIKKFVDPQRALLQLIAEKRSHLV